MSKADDVSKAVRWKAGEKKSKKKESYLREEGRKRQSNKWSKVNE